MSEQEKKNKRTGMIVSGGIHAALLILFFFILAWRAPNPPHPEYGIEINFGLDNVGSGETPQPTPPNNNKTVEDAKPEPKAAEEVVEEEKVIEEIPVVTPPPVREVVEAKAIESPDVEEKQPEKPVKEQPKPVKEVVKPTPEATVEKKTSEKVSATDGADGKAGESKEAAASNDGDNKDKVGDKGDPKGSLDSRALYGTPGGGDGGSSLSMTGWTWDFKPNPKESSNETGRIIFEVKIDDYGDILTIKTLESTVSPSVERVYRQEVQKLTFSKLSSNATPAPTSTGTITFVITSR